MYKLTLPLAASIALLASGCSNIERSRDLANPLVSGKTLAEQVCSACHGLDGNSVSPNFPSLAAQQKEYFSTQLDVFRKQSRSDPAGFEYMWGLSHHLTDKQIGELAEYFAAQKPISPGAGNPVHAVDGKRIFEEGTADKAIPACKTCHGEHGEGNAQFPRIAFQHSDYTVKQLGVFQRTDERPEGSIMKTIAHGLTPENMEDVAEYLQGMTVSATAAR